MIRHILILLWNRRRKMIWVFTEQILVFAVLLFCFTGISDTLKRYYEPGNVLFNDVAMIAYESAGDTWAADERADYATRFKSMVQTLKTFPNVEYVSHVSRDCVPATGWFARNDSVVFAQHKYIATVNRCDENYFRMFDFRMQSGRGLTDTEPEDGIPEAVITRKLADEMGRGTDMTGKIIRVGNRDFRVAGVLEAFKKRDTDDPQAAVFLPFYLSDSDENPTVLVQCKKGMFYDFSKEYLKRFRQNFPPARVQPLCAELELLRESSRLYNFLNVYLLSVPTVFLVVFAFFGTFGLLWMQSKKRFDEFGLRIAVGSTPTQLKRYLVAESLMLTSFAMIPGLIIAANLYAFASKGWEWLAAAGAAVVLMWLFAAFSAWFPAQRAAKITPVEALRMNQ